MKNQNYIWLIDDDSTDQFILENCSKRVGCKLSTFSYAEDALSQLKSNTKEPSLLPDWIFIDINMPLLSGWDFIEKYKELSVNLSKTPLLYMISYSILKEDLERAKHEKLITGFVSKPITEDSLSQIINHTK